MLNNITIGQYFPTNSVIHRLDARIKIIMTVLMIVTIFIASNIYVLLGLAALIFAAMCISKIKISTYFKMLKSIWFIILLTSVLNLFYVSGEKPIVSFWIITIYPEGVIQAIFISLRIALLIIISSLLTYTTAPTDLTDAIERLLSPLRFIGLGEGVHILAMMTSIALRFIPTLIEETDKIMSAQKARGAMLDSGNLISRVKAMLPILIPLLISATRRAYDLAEAMECRCYHGGRGRTKMRQVKMKARDYIALFIGLLIFALIILGRVLL